MRRIWYGLPLIFGFCFFIWPIAAMMQRAFFTDDIALEAVRRTLQSRATWGIIRFTAWQALLSTLFTIILALPAAYLFSHYHIPASGILRSLVAVPFVLPTVVVALAFSALFREQGLINRSLMQLFNLAQAPLKIEKTLTLVVLSHIFYNYTIVLRIVGGYWRNADPKLEEAARVLGASRWRLWTEIKLPLVAPAVLAAALLVFTFTFAAFGTVLILGGSSMRTIEVEIYDLAVNRFQLAAAALLSLFQMLTTLTLTFVYTRLQRRSAVPQATRLTTLRPLNTKRLKLWAFLIVGSMVFFVMLPLIALVISATQTSDGWSLRYFRMLSENQRGSYFFISPTQAMWNSLRFAGIATCLALIIGIPASYLLTQPRSLGGKLLDGLFMLPLGTSSVTLGFGYILAYRRWELPGGFTIPDLRQSPWIMPLAHSLLALPFVIRTMLPALRRLDPKIGEAALVLGASPRRRWLAIDLPLLLPAIIVSALFAFTISLGDFGAALILSVSGPEYATMPVVIYRFLGQAGATNYGQALAMSSLLMAVTLLSFMIIERFSSSDREF